MTTLQTLCTKAGLGLRCFCADERGATAIEYAVIAAGVSIMIVSAVGLIGSSVNDTFTSVSNGFN